MRKQLDAMVSWQFRFLGRVFRAIYKVVSIVIGVLSHVLNVIARLLRFRRDNRYLLHWQKSSHTFEPPPPRPPKQDTEKGPWFPFTLLDAHGRYIFNAVFTTLDKQQIIEDGLLPEGMELMDHHTDFPKDKHPVFYIFGYQQGLKPIWSRLTGISYLEFVMGIPNVRLAKKKTLYTGPFVYLPRLHLQHLYPTVLGLLAGYRKKWNSLHVGSSEFTIGSLVGGQQILSARFTEEGEVVEKGKVVAALGPWADLCNQPIVSKWFGFDVYTHFHWEFEFGVMRPARAEVTVNGTKDQVPGLHQDTHPFVPLTDALEGACQIVVPWVWIGFVTRYDLCTPPPPGDWIKRNRRYERMKRLKIFRWVAAGPS